MSKNRGFSALKGVTISRVDAAAVNQVVLLDSDGKYIYTIDVDVTDGIPVLTLTKRRNNKKAATIPEKKLHKKLRDEKPWPFPFQKDNSLD